MPPVDQPRIHVHGEGPRPEPGQQQPQPGPGSHCAKPAVTSPVPSQEPCTSLIRIKEKMAFRVERFVPLICKKTGQCNKPQRRLSPPKRPPRRGDCRWQQAPQDSPLVAEERVADSPLSGVQAQNGCAPGEASPLPVGPSLGSALLSGPQPRACREKR